MRITLAGHLEAMSGTHQDMVYVQMSNGVTYTRRRPYQCCGAPPPTAEQAQHRAYTSAAASNWISLTERQRDGWEQYARQYCKRNLQGLAVRPSALATYIKAGITRQILGQPLPTDPPVEPPPTFATIELIDVADPQTVRFLVRHRLASVDGYALLVRMAPPPKTDARKIYENQYRYICNLGPQSTCLLPPDGGEAQFSPTRFSVAPGQRYGIEVRVARLTDGTVGHATTAIARKSI